MEVVDAIMRAAGGVSVKSGGVALVRRGREERGAEDN